MFTAPSVLLVALGRNGSGKGTVLKTMAKAGILTHHEMSDLLKVAKSDPEIGRSIHHFMDRGKLVPDEIVADVFRRHCLEHLKCEGEHHGFGGACRTGEQVLMKMRWLRENFPSVLQIMFVELVLDHEDAMRRIQGRLESAVSQGEPPRTDDDPALADSRSREFDHQIGLVRLQAKDMFPGCYHQIDASGSPEEIAAEIHSLIRPGILREESLRMIRQGALAAAV